MLWLVILGRWAAGARHHSLIARLPRLRSVGSRQPLLYPLTEELPALKKLTDARAVKRL
jgi:hypothetical protein